MMRQYTKAANGMWISVLREPGWGGFVAVAPVLINGNPSFLEAKSETRQGAISALNQAWDRAKYPPRSCPTLEEESE